MNNLLEIVEIIKQHKSIAIFTHENADGDAIGSILGLGLSLKNLEKSIAYFVPEPVPQRFSFLKDFNFINKNSAEGFELAILLDAAESARIKELEEHLNQFKMIINIDHHASNGHFANYNLVDKNAPSTTSIIYRLIESGNLYIDSDISNALFTGLVTDTGSFHYANANIEAFEVASQLVKHGASPDYIGRLVYEQDPLPRLRILGLALERMVIDKFIAYSFITQSDLESFSASEEDTDGIVDVMRKVKGSRLIILFKETEQRETRVSLRGKSGFNVQQIAIHFGGGGHPQASGCTVKLRTEEAINEVINYIKEHYHEEG